MDSFLVKEHSFKICSILNKISLKYLFRSKICRILIDLVCLSLPVGAPTDLFFNFKRQVYQKPTDKKHSNDKSKAYTITKKPHS